MGRGGEGDSSGGAAADVLLAPQFEPFLTEDFNVASFTSRVLAGSHTTAQAQSEQLRDGVRALEGELASEVTSRHGELLRNVRLMLDAERSLGDVVLSVESLQSAIRRIRAEITGPYEQIRSRSRQLRNLRATVELLRHLIHRIKLAQKLRQQMAAPPGALDLAKAAKLITDIRAVDKEVDLGGVDAVASDEEFVRTAKQTVQAQAEAMLAEGMESMSQAKVGSALQVYFNLEELSQAVQALVQSHLARLEKLSKAALDPRHLSAAVGGGAAAAPSLLSMQAPGRPPTGAAQSWQDKLWSSLKELADQVAQSATAVWHLQRVVAKKKDPLTHVCFLDELVPPDQPLLTHQFWTSLVRILTEAFAAVAKPGTKSGAVRDALVAGYPKLAHVLESMVERLSAETTMKGVVPAVGPEQLQQLLGATAPLQSAYLASSLSRMSDVVVAAFPGGMRALTSPADVQKCISVIHEELKAGSGSVQMAVLAARTAGKALELLADKAEYMAATGPDVRQVQVGAAATAAQARNIALCSQLQEVHRSLGGFTGRLPAAAAQALGAALDTLQATAVECVAPIFKSVVESLEDRLLKVHALRFDGEGGAEGVTGTSPFIQDVGALITHFRSEFLAKFVPVPSPHVASCVGALVERMAARLLIFFVRHASLVRPLSQAGRLQLAKDLAELQLAVGAGLFPLEQLGQPYRVVKGFRSLLFAEPHAILTSSLLQDLPPSVIAHHLFTRLDASVQAPHERSGLSPAQYSLWLDTHTTPEVLRGVAAVLEAAKLPGPEADPVGHEAAQLILLLCKQALGTIVTAAGAVLLLPPAPPAWPRVVAQPESLQQDQANARLSTLVDVLVVADNDSEDRAPLRSRLARLTLQGWRRDQEQGLPHSYSIAPAPTATSLASDADEARWLQLQTELPATLATAKGRGGEYSELLLLPETQQLLTFDDHTGIAFELLPCQGGAAAAPPAPATIPTTWDRWLPSPPPPSEAAQQGPPSTSTSSSGAGALTPQLVPRWILAGGDGDSSVPFKAEWAAWKDGQVFVGSHGHDLVAAARKKARACARAPARALKFVKVIHPASGLIQHLDWSRVYDAVNSALLGDAAARGGGYVTHEAAAWSAARCRWWFAPRRVSLKPYSAEVDPYCGANVLVSCEDPGNTDTPAVVVTQVEGPTDVQRGFSALRFIPGTQDEHLVAIKTVERYQPVDRGSTFESYVTVLDTRGKVLLPETCISRTSKFEGLEVLSAGVEPAALDISGAPLTA